MSLSLSISRRALMHTCAIHVADFARDDDLRDIDTPDSYQTTVASHVSQMQQKPSIAMPNKLGFGNQFFHQHIFQ
jgi:hypothetical protein